MRWYGRKLFLPHSMQPRMLVWKTPAYGTTDSPNVNDGLHAGILELFDEFLKVKSFIAESEDAVRHRGPIIEAHLVCHIARKETLNSEN